MKKYFFCLYWSNLHLVIFKARIIHLLRLGVFKIHNTWPIYDCIILTLALSDNIFHLFNIYNNILLFNKRK